MIARLTLGIETSCDDTSVALVAEDGTVRALVSATKDLDHEPYGGIVPEIASRNHSILLLPLIDECLRKGQVSWPQISGIAVTNRPGLIGALIVGVVTAKSLSLIYKTPFLGVNHLEGHLVAPFLRDEEYAPPAGFTYPYVALAISGGHTSLYYVQGLGQYQLLGGTRDDAAGEAFDKFAKMLGLGFPGGVRLDKLAQSGNPSAYNFPRSMINDDNLEMSFSGLKSAGHRLVEELRTKLTPEEFQQNIPDLCASFQEAIVDVLLAKLECATRRLQCRKVVLTGGVSANSRLRARALEWTQKKSYSLVIPPLRYCTDNAAMIAYLGSLRMNQLHEQSDASLGPRTQSLPTDFSAFLP